MQDVKTGRQFYIGGSDIPVILGISPFKTRFQLLQEKAGLRVDNFQGNSYTEYGNYMEGYIRDFIADKMETIFFEGEHVSDGFSIPCKCHTDGENDSTVIEIKTTSQIHDNLEDYKNYLVQLLFYMWISRKHKGVLAVYHRPQDMSTDFDESRLQLFEVNYDDYTELIGVIFEKLCQFIEDVNKLKENPELSEVDLMPLDIVRVTESIVTLENQLLMMKDLEKSLKESKAKLKKLMEDKGIDKFETNNGYKLALIKDTEDTVEDVTVFHEDQFKESHPRLFKKFSETVSKVKKGRSGYVKITIPKGKE